MTITSLPISSLYQDALRSDGAGVDAFAPLHGLSRFICIFSPLFSWSNKGEMQI